MKKLFILILAVLTLLLCSCAKESAKDNQADENLSENVVLPDFDKEELDKKFGTSEIYIVKTYLESPADKASEYLDNGLIFTTVKHYQLSDGTWKTDNFNYKYKLSLTGRLNNAAKDSTYEVLSNSDDITFDMAWKASGLSSNTADYFNEEDAIIVAIG